MKEYRAFVDSFKLPMIANGSYDSLVIDHPVWYPSSEDADKIDIQIRSKLWVDEFPLHMGDPMMEYYFSHEEFDEYPVVAITYQQCLAFIEWKNEKLTTKLKALGFDMPWGAYRLPSRDEWTYASGAYPDNQWLDENQTHKRIYPWDGHTLRHTQDKTYMANLGKITDMNGITIKSFYDDGFMFTSPVKEYYPNDFGLYNIAGNVSEWTSTTINYDSLLQHYQYYYQLSCFSGDSIFYEEINKPYPNWQVIDSLTEIEGAHRQMWRNPLNNRNHQSLKKFVYYAKIEKPMETHNLELLKEHKELQIVKGGDWFRGPVYLRLSAEQGFHKQEASVTVGMRLALDLDPQIATLLGEDFGVYDGKTKRQNFTD